MNRRTVQRGVVVALLVLVGIIAAGWVRAGGSDGDARDLKQRLRGLDGVVSVNGGYTQSEDFPLAGSSTFLVAMEPEATTDDVLAVVTAAYDEFGSTFRRDPADLAVEVQGGRIELHTQGPDAEEDDLLEVVRYALDAHAAGETVEADINARDYEDLDDLVSEIRLHLPDGSAVDDVLPRLAAAQASNDVPADTDFYVLAEDGSGLGGSRGLPTEEDVLVWRDLSAVRLPGVDKATVRVEYGPYQIYSGMQEYGFANITVRSVGQRVTTEQLAALIEQHRRILGDHHGKYVYNLTLNGEDRAWLRARGSAA